MSEKKKKNIRIGLSFAQVVVQSLIVYHAYKQYKLTKKKCNFDYVISFGKKRLDLIRPSLLIVLY
jgi:hypothetical protein